ncbi:3-phosphoshikimate 1-carboxyvinyltransferase [Clostridiales bacterium CHKCI006]|nr:3-phosphoshikimate 1-carboxyvinyltransferase [Clostridiales bacterium CHKCI006]
MKLRIEPVFLKGNCYLPASKSLSHRALIIAMLSRGINQLRGILDCDDTQATLQVIEALGGHYHWQEDQLFLDSRQIHLESARTLEVNASGSTLRFMLPILQTVGGVHRYHMHPSLARRTLAAYEPYFEMSRQQERLWVDGRLKAGEIMIEASQSSQFVSGMLFALPLLDAPSRLVLQGECVSVPYYEMTYQLLKEAGVSLTRQDARTFLIDPSNYHFHDGMLEGDWSAAAFIEAANFLGMSIDILNRPTSLLQGDREIVRLLQQIRQGSCQMDVRDVPDLVPALALAMALTPGHFELNHAARLKDKESNRLESVAHELNAMGAKITVAPDGLSIEGVDHLHGAQVDAHQDHRIAMMLSIAACLAQGETILNGAECVAKSWPQYFTVFRQLGGKCDEC